MADATSSRPRPRPKPKAKQPLTETQATTNAARSSSAPTSVADTDDMFIINRKRDNKTWQRLEKINNDAALKAETLRLSSDSGDEGTPRSRQKKPRVQADHRPVWERNKNIKRLLSQDPSDSDSGESLMYVPDEEATPNGKSKDKGKRKRSRSRSITPPPPLSQEQIMFTKQSIRARLGVVPRTASPTLQDFGDSTNDLNLAPELRAIAEKIKSQPSLPRVEGLDELEITVRWVPHPDDPQGRRQEFGYKITKSSTFHDLFDAVANDLRVPVDRVRLLYKNHRFFPSVKPSTLNIWSDAVVFVGCDVKTYDYSRVNPSFQLDEELEDFSEEPSHDTQPDFEESAPTESHSQQQESDAEPEAEDTFRIILRSNVTSGRDITVAVKSTTTCGAIVKAFLKKADLVDEYPAVFNDLPPVPSRSKGRKEATPLKIPQLSVDGDKLPNDSEIGNADLDDGDMVDVVGL